MISGSDNQTAGKSTGETLTFPDMPDNPAGEVWVACAACGALAAGRTERPRCPRCGQETEFLETACIDGQPRTLCGACVDFLKARRRRRPGRLRLPDRPVAARLNRRLMPPNRLGPDATCARKATI